jgi:DNA polymerase III sliding clamp (beta) subunit (PCNA family)
MENENEVQSIPTLEAINLPLYALRTALTCASDEESRRYLNGVFVHATDDEYRIAATDGIRLFVYSTPIESERVGASVPEWVRKGLLIPREGLKERLALLDKLEYSTAAIAYATGAGHLVISDTHDTARSSCSRSMARSRTIRRSSTASRRSTRARSRT